jgi:hypothetical protein
MTADCSGEEIRNAHRTAFPQSFIIQNEHSERMDTRFVVTNLLQYSLLYAGLTVGGAFLLGGEGLVLLVMGASVLYLLSALQGDGNPGDVQASDPAGFGAALGSGEGDYVSPRDAVRLGGAGRLYYAVGVLLLGVALIATRV